MIVANRGVAMTSTEIWNLESGRRTLKRMFRDAAAMQLWSMTLRSRRMQISDRIRNPSVWSHFWDKTSSRVYLFMRLGSLRFRETWGGHYEARGCAGRSLTRLSI